MLVVNMIKGSIKANWQLQETISKIRRLMEHGQFAINHCYREINMAADTLTNLGVLNKYRTIFNTTVSMPTQVKAIVKMDRVNMLTFRIKPKKGSFSIHI